jgi:hypothetical protein
LSGGVRRLGDKGPQEDRKKNEHFLSSNCILSVLLLLSLLRAWCRVCWVSVSPPHYSLRIINKQIYSQGTIGKWEIKGYFRNSSFHSALV